MSLKPLQIFQFGEFVVDPSRRCLLRDGSPVFLPTKAFDILLLMVENPGRVLTRDEILRSVWPDTVVEEGNLSQNIFLIRKALGESAGEPRYVLTVFGSGYQLTANIERRTLPSRRVEDFPSRDAGTEETQRSGPRLIAGSAVPAILPDLQQDSAGRPALVMPPPRANQAKLWWGISAAVLVVIGLATAAWLHWRTIPADDIHLLLAELDNSTGDATFDHALNRALQIDLQQSPSIVLYSDGRVRRILGQMQLAPTDKVTPEIAREACQRLNGQAVLEPMIASFGGHYLLTMSARSCVDGHILGDRKQEATDKAGVLAALDKLADGIRHDIGESRASILRYDVPMVEGETASLDALKAYSEATRLYSQGKMQEAVAMFQKAIDLDPKFAIAYADLSSMEYDLGEHQRDRDNITRAYALRDNVNDRYRYYIEYRYNMSVTGDLHQAINALVKASAVYPHDGSIASNLCNLENWIGNYSEAVKYADKLLDIDRVEGYNAIGYEIAARAYKHANQFDRALAVGAESAKKIPSAGMLGILVQIAGIQHKQADIDHWIEVSKGTPNESHVLQEAGAAALYAGNAQRSMELFQQAHVAAKRDNAEDDLLDLDATQARMLVEVGLRDQAAAAVASLPKMDDAMDAVYAMAEVGDPAKAEQIAQERVKATPQDELLTSEYVPAVRAAIAMRNGHPADAIAAMAADAPYEMRDPTVPYLLGQAYLAAGKPQQAIEEFKKFLDNPGIDDPLSPLYALCYLGTARAQAAMGQTQAAIASYQKFFDFWKTADSNLPVLAQAHAEFAKLQPAAAH